MRRRTVAVAMPLGRPGKTYGWLEPADAGLRDVAGGDGQVLDTPARDASGPELGPTDRAAAVPEGARARSVTGCRRCSAISRIHSVILKAIVDAASPGEQG
ncbi:hypothetical protein [Streptomyces shaanxiensis]